VSLTLRKGYEAITVQDIIDEADVGGSTFYAHYTGKEDLLRSGFQSLRTELTEAQRSARAKLRGAQDLWGSASPYSSTPQVTRTSTARWSAGAAVPSRSTKFAGSFRRW
jgi:AcrR family transcriptional regulator